MPRRSAVPWALLLSLASPPAAAADGGGPDPCARLAWGTLAQARSVLWDIRTVGSLGSIDYLDHNNSWMEYTKNTLREQGVGASLVNAGGWRDRPPLRKARNLVIHADPRSANPAERLYGRLAMRLGAKSVTASIVETVPFNDEAFFRPNKLRVEIGSWAALDMLEGRKNHFALHEFRHLMFERRRRRGVHSVFDLAFETSKTAPFDLYGDAIESWIVPLHSVKTIPFDLYGNKIGDVPPRKDRLYVRYEELYNYASDVAFLAGRLESLDPDRLAPAAEHLDHSLLTLENLAVGTRLVLDDLLENFDDAYRSRRSRWLQRLRVLTTPWGGKLTVPTRLATPIGRETRRDALRRVLAEARDLSSDIRELAAAARALPIEAEGKLRTVRELRRLVRRADRRTMVKP